MAKLSDVLAQPTVTIKHGDILASLTRAEGYVPTIKGTTSLSRGKYLFKVVGVGTPVDGKYANLNIVPIVAAEDNKSFVDDVANPIVIQQPTKVIYTTGRNDREYKDVYRGNTIFTDKEVVAGQEHRVALLAFIEFVKSEYSLGVNDFVIGGAELIPGA